MNYKYEWLLFDADGTLLNYDQSEKHALTETFKAFQIDNKTNYLQKYRRINANLWSELERSLITSEKLRVKRFDILFNDLKLNISPANFSEKYLNALGKTGFLIKGARELLNKLDKSINLAIITNGIKEVQNSRLQKTKLNKYFKHLIISEEVGVAKPDKLFFEYTLNKINFYKKNGILIIGDSLKSDILGGNMSNIDTCWFNPTNKKNRTNIKPTYEINNLMQIIDVI
ncbi:MAG: noncanonical pyrimidine nucleotidase, YjjG family [Bacteroidetes bacterium]|nr:MAG: noncanonical pyrimidine nucleotidase, YjjG family [Bacteroidota bacterium]